MKVTLHEDGSLEFPEGMPPGLLLTNYHAHPDKPNTFVPRHLPCIHRENKCRLSPCKARLMFNWQCHKYKKSVSARDCEDCNGRE